MGRWARENERWLMVFSLSWPIALMTSGLCIWLGATSSLPFAPELEQVGWAQAALELSLPIGLAWAARYVMYKAKLHRSEGKRDA